MGNYALVKMIDDVETVDNIAVASEEFAQTYLVANGGDYDYVLDQSLYDPEPQLGYLYDPGTDTFSAPTPPVDYKAELEDKLSELHTILQEALDAASNLSEEDVASGLSTGIANISAEFSTNESDLFDDISDYITNGG